MLEIIKLKKRSDIGSFFSDFNAKEETWLVSDLRTKLELQNRLIDRDSYYVDTTVLRATDLWQILFQREFPEKKVMSREWARILLGHFLKQHASRLNLNEASAGTLLEMVDFFLPIFSHPEGHDRFTEWLEKHSDIKERWADWYLLSKLSYQYLFNDRDIVIPSWYSSLLIQKEAALNTWQRPLWIDLGGQILWSEAELLRALSRFVDVRVFCVENEWQKDFAYKLRPYAHLESQTSKTLKIESKASTSKKVKTYKFSGELAEIREAVAQVRIWLDEGIPAREIGILAPDIEKYWPALKLFLEKEGVPVNKNSICRLSSWPSVQEWMGGLRLRLKEVRKSHLEIHYFQQSRQGLNYEEFQSLFNRLLTVEDLKRDERLAELYSQALQVSENPTRDEWIVFLSRQWPAQKDAQPLAAVLEELSFQCPSSMRLPLAEWFEQLEALVVRKEMVIQPADPEGLHLASLLAAPSLWLKKRIFLGLSEDGLKHSSSQFLTRFEVEKLFLDLGFYLENHELSAKDYELRLLADCDSEEDVFCFGAMTLSGEVQAPSGFWLKHALEEKLSAPKKTRWDEIQSNAVPFKEELVPFPPLSLPSLSPSRIEKYRDCPFKFASEALFKLQDLPEVDLGVDPRNYGNFVHDLFERLTVDLNGEDFSDSQMAAILQELYEKDHAASFHPELWPAYKKKLMQIGRRFVDFEKDWQSRFPRSKIVEREKKWAVELNGFTVSGKIDRVDTDGDGRYVVLDYKSGASSAINYSKWFEENKLQLLFYIWALEKTLQGQGEVAGAFFYVFKNMERSRGLALADKGQNLFPTDGRYGSFAEESDKKFLLSELESALSETMENIKNGIFAPKPRDLELCHECRWKKLCRAPHLK